MKKENAKVGMTVTVFGNYGTIIEVKEHSARVALHNGYEAGYLYEYIHKPRKED